MKHGRRAPSGRQLPCVKLFFAPSVVHDLTRPGRQGEMEIVPFKKIGPFVLGAKAEDVRKAVGGEVISDEAEDVDGERYPATDLFPATKQRCEVSEAAECDVTRFFELFVVQYAEDMTLALVETSTSAVLQGKDLFKLGGGDKVFDFVKKLDATATKDETGFTAPELGLSVYYPEGADTIEMVTVYTRAHYEQRKAAEAAGPGQFDDEEDDDDDEDEGSGFEEDDEPPKRAASKRGRAEEDDEDDE